MSAETWRNDKKKTYGFATTYFPGGPVDAAQVIALGPSEQRPDLNFRMHASRAVRLSGIVRRETGEVVGGAGVYRFSIAGLPAGSYRAIARDFIEEGQWEDRKFLEDAREGAARFELSQGGSETITLRLRVAK